MRDLRAAVLRASTQPVGRLSFNDERRMMPHLADCSAHSDWMEPSSRSLTAVPYYSIMIDKLAGLDLNLLVSLNAILTQRSVSKAAVQLGFSQPSLSLALRRLRVHFDDELLTRNGNTYSLTPLAVSLSENVTTALDSVRKVFSIESIFDPAVATREFVVRGSDHSFATIGAALCAAADVEAPGVFFRFMNAMAGDVDHELDVLEQSDAMFLPPGALPGLPNMTVFKDHWVCILAADNTRVGESLTLEEMSELPWVFTHQSRRAPRPAVAQLRMLGVEPLIECVVDSFVALPWFLIGTDRVALVPAQLASLLLVDRRLRWVPCPYEAVLMSVQMYWHPKHTHDAGHQWLRRLVRDVGQSFTPVLDKAEQGMADSES